MGPQHVHHSYIWLGGLRTAVVVLVAVGFGFGPALLSGEVIAVLSGRIPLSAFLLIALACLALVIFSCAVALALHWLSWHFLTYELAETEVNRNSGFISKKRVHVPYQRIQSVDQTASLLQRLLGLCNVKLDTAGGSENKPVLIPYVTKATAEQLRMEIFARKAAILSGEPVAAGSYVPVTVGGNALDAASSMMESMQGIFSAASPQQEPPRFEARLSNKQLFFAGVSNIGTGLGIAAATVAGVLSVASSFTGALLDRYEAQLDMFVEHLINNARAEVFGIAAGIVAVVVVIALIGWVISLLRAYLVFGGFVVRRRASRIEVEQGLLKREYKGVDIDRVQSVVVRQGWIRQLIGYAEVAVARVDTISKEKSQSGKNASVAQGVIIHPFIRISEVPWLLSSLAPEIPCVFEGDMRPAANAKLRAVWRSALWRNAGFWCLLVFLLGGLLSLAAKVANMGDADLVWTFLYRVSFTAAALCLVPIALGAVKGILWHKRSSVMMGEDFLLVKNGGLSCQRVIIPRCKIQYGGCEANPFQRWKGVRTLCVTTAAAAGTTTRFWDLSLQDADAWVAWLRPRR